MSSRGADGRLATVFRVSERDVEESARRVTLADIVENVHVGIIELLATPAGLDVEVGEVVIHDPVEDGDLQPGDIVLAVGTPAHDRRAFALVDRAAAAGAAAVVLRARGDHDASQLIEYAAAAGVAVLAVPSEMTWGQLHSLLRTARTTAGADAGHSLATAPVGDLFALANALAASIGGPVTIEDPHSTVLAYSSLDEAVDDARRSTILGRRVPEEWIRRLRAEGVFRALWSGTDPVRLDLTDTDPGLKPRIALAVRAGDEILGSIWVAEGDRPLGAEAEAALREGAQIAALHLIRHRAGEDLERRRRSDQLRAVLDGRVPTEVLAGTLGLTTQAMVTVAVFSVEDGTDSDVVGLTALAERAAGIIALHCEAFRRQASVVTMGAAVYVLLPHGDTPDRSAVVDFVRSVADRSMEALRGRMVVALGASAPLADVAASRHEADRVLRAIRAEGHGRAVATIDDVRSTAFLLELAELVAERPHLRDGKLRELAQHDAAKGTDYVATLRAYLDAFGDVPQAAAAVDVHPNTFRYRLRRLGELASLDLDDPVERLVVSVQLALGRLG